MSSQSCKTCKHAVFPRTPTGRIKRNEAGKCAYPIEMPKIPISVSVRMSRMWITQDAGASCPTYEAK